jgi:hypothetical protein
MLKGNPELKESINEALEKFAESDHGQHMAARFAFSALAKQIFDSMLTVMCVSVDRIKDKNQIYNEIVLPIGDFVMEISEKALDSEESLALCCRHVMLRTRALAEDALGLSRYDGTEKGSETPCPK